MGGAKRSTVYQIEYDWRRSPEVWGAMIRSFLFGVVAGAILLVYVGCADVVQETPCKPPATQAPRTHSNP